jgi:dienelactone hydrolase
MRRAREIGARCAVILGALLLLPASAAAANPGDPISSVFAGRTVNRAAIPCVAQADGVRVCHGTVNGSPTKDLRLKSFDGQPLEVYVILPPAPSSGTDGPYPLIVQSHGWGNSAGGPNNNEFFGPTADAWAQRGYAVLQLTARGFHDSCGSPISRFLDASGCKNGYIRLDDERYEARDVQYAIGLLVDAGIADPAHIGVTGESYGGGVSLELATLKDRVMNANGTLSPWKSPNGTALRVAAAAPMIPWSELNAALIPNGRTLDSGVQSPTVNDSPVGVEKQSLVGGLYALGSTNGFYSNNDPQAQLPGWYGLLSGGEPYDTNPLAARILTYIDRYHSPYSLLAGTYGTPKEPPSPLLIGNGFTDDLFPVDEALRYYNYERGHYPGDPISLFDGDFGHPPSNNKPGDIAALSTAIQTFFDFYLKGIGTQPTPNVTAMIETCPKTVPSGGPFTAATWAALHPHSVTYSSRRAQRISSEAGSTSISKVVDPVFGGGACATLPAADQGAGVATYRLPAATGRGYTLLGSPTVTANLTVRGTYAYIAERLWDVDRATGKEILVARGVYRIDANKPNGVQLFQLHPGAWHFAAGHIPKLELLGQDSPYLRKSNGAFTITVKSLKLQLPIQ